MCQGCGVSLLEDETGGPGEVWRDVKRGRVQHALFEHRNILCELIMQCTSTRTSKNKSVLVAHVKPANARLIGSGLLRRVEAYTPDGGGGRVPLGDEVDGPRERVRFHMVPQTLVDHPERRRCVQPQGCDLPEVRGLGVGLCCHTRVKAAHTRHPGPDSHVRALRI